MVRSYLCDNSNNSVLLITACSTGTVDMILGWISPDKVAKQVGKNDMNVIINNRITDITESHSHQEQANCLCMAGCFFSVYFSVVYVLFSPVSHSYSFSLCLSVTHNLHSQVPPSQAIRFRVHQIISLQLQENS